MVAAPDRWARRCPAGPRGAVGRRAFAGRIYRWGGVVALGAALLLPACTILPKAEPLDVYLLPAIAPVSASATQAAPWRCALPSIIPTGWRASR